MKHDHRVRPDQCVNCGHGIDYAGLLEAGRAPQPGDFSVCIRCGHLMAYDAKMRLRELTGDEIVEAAGDPEVVAIVNAVGRARRFLDPGT